MRALNHKLVRDLWRMRAQMLAIALVIGAGVALFITLKSAFDSLDLTRRTYYERFRFAQVFASLERAPESLSSRIAEIPGVAAVQTRVASDVTLDLPDVSEPVVGRLISIPGDRRPALNDLYLRTGRWIEPGHREEVLVAENFARAHHLAPGDSLAAILNGRRRELQIVGLAMSPEYVYTIRPGEIFPDAKRFGVIWMGEKPLASAFDMRGAFNDLTLALSAGADVGEVISRLDTLLRPYGGLGAVPRARQTSHWYLESELQSLRGMGAIVPVIFLGVAAFLLNVVLSRIVALEREQIAALKALGYRDRTIAGHYVLWGLAVAAVGIVLGTLAGTWLGVGMTRIYTQFFQFPILRYRLLPGTVVTAALVSLAAAVVGALGAVRRAVRLPPAEAMRPEPPARFRRSWVERAGLGRFLSQPARIIFRNLERRPGRAFLSIVGIAFGGAMIIVGNFSYDAIDRMIELQFELAQRYDALVTFVRPASPAALHELQRLPGVLDVEPFRAVPVRLRVGYRSHEGSIQGLQSAGRLNRLIDASGRVVTLPPGGLVMSAKLAEILHVAPGDDVTVEVLEGRRPTARVRLARVVEDYIGTSAYMETGALHRLMHEAPTLSGAFLEIDSSAVDELFRRLKATPAVAGVMLERAALESFRETLAENVGIVRTINVVFAIIIAFGVIYNNARTALSERARELATLRVIGFTQGEIAYILLGELAVLTLVATVVGLGLGYLLAYYTAQAYDTEVYRIPLVVARGTYALSAATVLVASLLSALAVLRRLHRLDLIAVLKTRE